MRPHAHHALKLADLAAAEGRRWRVHGNGMAQMDLTADGGTRLHLWHPDLPRQSRPTPIHDHRFSFTSRVVAGRLFNVRYSLGSVSGNTHHVYEAQPQEGTQNTTLVRLRNYGEVHPIVADVALYQPGQSYVMNAKIYHETVADQPTATVMTKARTDHSYRPRVLVPIAYGDGPDNTFHRDEVSQDEIWRAAREILG